MNKNIKKRDEIIFGAYNKDDYKMGGVKHFRYMDVDTLKKLLDKDFIEADECQNSSPSTSEFLEFMESHPSFTAHGYAVSDTRDDYRVTIEGIECDDYANEIDVIKDFIRFARYADELCIDNGFYCWWD